MKFVLFQQYPHRFSILEYSIRLLLPSHSVYVINFFMGEPLVAVRFKVRISMISLKYVKGCIFVSHDALAIEASTFKF